MTQGCCGNQTKNSERHREGKATSQMSPRTRVPRALHPAQLIPERSGQRARREHVMNKGMRKNDFVSGGPNFISQFVIVRVIVGGCRDPANCVQRVAAECYCWPKCKTNAFKHIGYDYSRGHFYRHAKRFE